MDFDASMGWGGRRFLGTSYCGRNQTKTNWQRTAARPCSFKLSWVQTSQSRDVRGVAASTCPFFLSIFGLFFASCSLPLCIWKPPNRLEHELEHVKSRCHCEVFVEFFFFQEGLSNFETS